MSASGSEEVKAANLCRYCGWVKPKKPYSQITNLVALNNGQLSTMIEDPKFTLKVLKYFAKEDVTFPANITADDLRTKEFPDVTLDHLLYHIRCAVELGLLEAQCSETSTFDGVIHTIGFISGLTAIGGEYVRNSETKFWDDALKKVKEVGMAITTSALLNCMNTLMANAIR